MKINDLILKTEKIDWQNIKDLQPVNLKNNYHSDKTKNSIIKNGFARAIYVWQDSKGDIYTVDGHLRADILRELKNEGYDIPDQLNCTFLDLPNKKTAIKYLLQVFNQKTNPINQSNMEIWLDDNEIVLEDMEIDLDELHIELNDEVEAEEEQEEVKEDEVPEVKHNFVVKGDLFELIDEEQGLIHRVLCGDSTMIDDVEKVMNGEKADMVFTSPPYNANAKTGDGNIFNKKKHKKMYQGRYIDNLESCDYIEFSKKVLSICFDVTDGFIFWNVSYNAKSRFEYIKQIEDKLEYLIEQICWKKSSTIPFKGSFMRDWEPVYVFSTNKKTLGLEKVTSNIWDISNAKSQSENHKACFPVKLPEKAIFLINSKTGIVLDVFLGSGSTLIACQQTKRKCYGIELDEHYCGVIITRWKNYMEKEGKKYSIKRNGEQFNLENGSSNII